MNICVANSKDQTKKLKHKGSTGKKKDNETDSETITENEGERNGKKVREMPCFQLIFRKNDVSLVYRRLVYGFFLI